MCFLAAEAARADQLGDERDGGADIVVTATPLFDPGEDVPGFPAQSFTDEDLALGHALDATELLQRVAGGVFVNEIQGNPLQPDLNYRGFTASPLLGTPQGLSVYVDGVRINQPFGDVVSWDLIPKSAIRSLTLIPGSNPLFGRNALGGALAIATKEGRSDPGVGLEASYGAFDRRIARASAGGATGEFHWFAAGDYFAEDGWRDRSPTEAGQAFVKLGWARGGTEAALSVSAADTRLTGNGLQEMRLLAADRRSVYTFPDTTRNRAWLVNLTGRHAASDAVALSGNAFWRSIRTRTLNGDANDEVLGTAFGARGEGAFPRLLCLEGGEPDETCSGLLNRSRTGQREWGTTIEAAITTPWFAGGTLTLGGAYVDGRAVFAQTSQFGFLTEQRGVIGVDDSFDDDAEVALSARTRVLSLYALNALKVTPALDIDVSARFDQSWIRNRDGITPGGGPGSLDGDHRFTRFNPAVAVRWSATDALGFDAALAQTSRVPSAIELGCADPETPCRLPNALAGDPPLDQVVATTVEAGATWIRSGMRLRVGLFQTTARRDILFVADDQAGFGYFRNFGRTRRQGADLDLTARLGAWRASVHYTFLDATYRSPEVVGGAANSANDGPAPGFEGAIEIEPGDRIPLLPRHLFKAGLAWDAAPWATLSADLQASSGVIARGNENNAHSPDGLYTLGPGRTQGYAVVNAGIELKPRVGVTLFAQVNNLFNARYASAAQLGATAFDASGRYVSQPFAGPEIDGEQPLLSSTFYAPGAPRSVQIGLRATF